jgi:hypothetical protein
VDDFMGFERDNVRVREHRSGPVLARMESGAI